MAGREQATAAERIAEAVAELLEEVTTTERLQGHRRVARGGRQVAMAEVLAHRTSEPGLLDQLQAVASRPGRRLERTPITTVREVEVKNQDGEPRREMRRVQLRSELLDERGRVRLQPAWDKEAKRTVLEPVTVPLTRVARAPVGPGSAAAGVARPGAMVPGGSAGWDADGALAPGRRGAAESRPPTTDALDLLLHIHTAARALYRRMLAAAAAAGRARDARPRRGLDAILRHLVSLAAVVDDHDAERAASAVRSWVTSARTLIGYEAPIVQLRDICCPDCGGRLAVRADGTTPVWCTSLVPIAGPALPGDTWPIIAPCPTKYPRASWLDLFEPGGTEPIGPPPRRRLPHATDIEGHGGRA